MPDTEGVIKYQLDFSQGISVEDSLIQEINAWRHILFLLKLIGRDALRYGGYGYGNVSCRVETNCDTFVISGTQTAHLPELDVSHYVRVSQCDVQNNHIVAEGPVKPSSEALTHGALYQSAPKVNAVLHVHCPQIWRYARLLGIASTARDVAYGTPQMAHEIENLIRRQLDQIHGVFVMGGHEDGVIAFGETAEQAGSMLINIFARALQC